MGYPAKQYSAFGETKSLQDWAKDDRCHISFVYLALLKRKGGDLETILSAPRLPEDERARILTAFGETKMAHEWAEDARCKVSLTAICQRLDRGMSSEEAISSARADIGPKLEAFGEHKTISEWSRDPRCVVSRSALGRRVARGEELEDALTFVGRMVSG